MAKEQIGGCVIVRPAPITYMPNSVKGFTLISDTHIGANNFDEKLLRKELADADTNGDRILINGDVFDMILTKDHRRFEPDVLHPRLRGSKDIVNGVIDWAVEIFSPYVHLLDMIGVGNHDTAVSKWSSMDPVKFLIGALQSYAKPGHRIHHGGYTGFVDYRFRLDSRKGHGKRLVIYYHHGTGSAGMSNKGIGSLQSKLWVESDVTWMGHYHTKVNASMYRMSCPQAGYEPKMRELRQIVTGAYLNIYKGQTQQSIRQQGRKAPYSADSGYEPEGKGGARLLLHFTSADKPYEMKVVQ